MNLIRIPLMVLHGEMDQIETYEPCMKELEMQFWQLILISLSSVRVLKIIQILLPMLEMLLGVSIFRK